MTKLFTIKFKIFFIEKTKIAKILIYTFSKILILKYHDSKVIRHIYERNSYIFTKLSLFIHSSQWVTFTA